MFFGSPTDSGSHLPMGEIAGGSEMWWLLAAANSRLAACHINSSHQFIVHDPSRRRFPLIVRTILGLIDANDFLELTIAPGSGVVPRM